MKHCLVVDDSSVIRKVARRILEDLSFEISEAEDGGAALDACRKHMPDAVLLDWNMPVMDGLEFLGQLRKLGAARTPRSSSARPRTMWRISPRRSGPVPTNTL